MKVHRNSKVINLLVKKKTKNKKLVLIVIEGITAT